MALNETRLSVREQHSADITMFSRVHYIETARDSTDIRKLARFTPTECRGSFKGPPRPFPACQISISDPLMVNTFSLTVATQPSVCNEFGMALRDNTMEVIITLRRGRNAFNEGKGWAKPGGR